MDTSILVPCNPFQTSDLQNSKMRNPFVLSHYTCGHVSVAIRNNTNLLIDPQEGRNSDSLAACLDPAKLKCSVTHNLSSLPPNQISSAVSFASKADSLPQGVLLDFHVKLSRGS